MGLLIQSGFWASCRNLLFTLTVRGPSKAIQPRPFCARCKFPSQIHKTSTVWGVNKLVQGISFIHLVELAKYTVTMAIEHKVLLHAPCKFPWASGQNYRFHAALAIRILKY